MIGIRKALKSRLYIYDPQVQFTEEDFTCKYINEIIYKKNNNTMK